MDPAQTDRLLRGLFLAGPHPPGVRAAAERAAAAAPDPPALADALAALRLVTRYQQGKIKHGRVRDLLFGPYLICEKIGEGGMGKVYKALDPAGTAVALKVVRPHLMANSVVQRRYEREARAAASFDHPNIIKLLAEDTVDGRYFLAMEYVDGSDLSRLVREFGKPPDRGLADPQEAAEYIRQAALGLQHAHDRGFVHRDVKPSNLLAFGDRPLAGTTPSTGLKLLDMGLVRRLMGSDEDTRADLTRDGTVVGTPDYMSPEQAKNSSTVDGRADLYSLGCTLYFLLHGRPPFDGGSPIDKLLAHHTQPPPDARAGRPDVPPGLAAVVTLLLQKNPADRLQSGAAVAAALAPFCPGGTPAPTLEPLADFSLAPAVPAAAEGPAPAAAPVTGRGLRLKVSVPPPPARVPPATHRPRADAVPSSGSYTGRDSADPTPVTGPHSDRTRSPAADTPPPRTRRLPRKPARSRRPVWPLVAAAAGAVVLLGVAAALIARGPAGGRTPATPPTTPDPAPPPGPVRVLGPADAVADGATAVLVLRPKAVAGRLSADGPGRLPRFVKRLAQAGFDPARLDRVTVSLVGRAAVAVGDGTGPAAVVATDPTVKSALDARRGAGRPPVELSPGVLAAVRATNDVVATIAADGGFVLPTGTTLADERVKRASAVVTTAGDGLDVSLTVAGQDRRTLVDFLSLELATKLPLEVPAVRAVVDKLALAEPTARRTDDALELTVRFRVEWAELVAVLEQVLPGE